MVNESAEGEGMDGDEEEEDDPIRGARGAWDEPRHTTVDVEGRPGPEGRGQGAVIGAGVRSARACG